MSNNEKDIEKRIKENFEHQDFEIQDAWLNDMSEKLDDFNKKPKRRVGFWLLLGGLGLGALAGAYQYANHYLNVSENITTNDTQKAKLSNTENIDFIYTEEPCLDEKISETKTNISTAETKNAKQKTNGKNTLISSKNTSKNAVKNQSKKSAQITSSIAMQNMAQTNASLNIETDKDKKEEKSKEKSNETGTKSEFLAHNEQSTTQNFENSSVSETQKTSEINFETKNEETILSTEESKEESHTENEKTNQREQSITQNLQDSLPLETPKSRETLPDDSVKTADEKPTKVDSKLKKNLGLSVALTAGPSFIFRNFNSTTQNEKRSTEENYKIAWNASLEIYKTFQNKLIVGTGIQATTYGERINYTPVSYSVFDTTFALEPKNYLNLNITKSSMGVNIDTSAIIYYDTIYSISETLQEDASVSKANGSTNFTYLEVPILIGYKILDTEKFDISATTGISFGFLISKKGFYLDTENNLNPAENSKINYNFALNTHFSYQVTKHISLSLAPNFKYTINNQSDFADTKKRYAVIGLNGGFLFDF